MRVEKTIRNIKTAMLYQITILLVNFIDRKLFLSILGVNYLGLNGLFTNIITMLSLAELGVGTAIIYNLYAPLEKGDKEEVAALMQLYKKVYYVIGLVIALIGIILMFFLPFVIKEQIYEISYIRKVYLIFLTGTVLTYFTGYKRSLLYADQKNYILLLGDITANTMGVITKILVLLIWKNYIGYIVIHTIFKLIPNIWASYKVDQTYSYIKEIKSKLPVAKLEEVKNNIKDLFIHKISHFVVTSTDNLIISSVIGLSAVGFISNYNMIIGALMGFIAQGVEALQAGMGNLVAVESKDKIEEVYDRLTFATFWIGSFCVVALACLIQPFIGIWLGETYIMQGSITLLIILNFFLWVVTRPLWQILTVSGLFKEDKINAIAEMAVNFIISIILVYRWGVAGVLIGTTTSYIVAWVMKSNLLYTKFFQKSASGYYRKMGLYTALTIVQIMITYKLSGMIKVQNNYIRFGLQMIICAIIPNVINYILFSRTKEFNYFKRLIKGVIMELIGKLKTKEMVDRIQKMLFVIMAVLLFILPIELTTLPGGKVIGKLIVRSVFAISGIYIVYLLMIRDFLTQKAKKTIWIYIVCGLGLAIFSFLVGGSEPVKTVIKSVLVVNTFIAFAYIDYSKVGKMIYILDIGFITYIVAIVLHYAGLENKPRSYMYIFNNPNCLGLLAVLMILLCSLAYAMTSSKRYFLYAIPFVGIITLTRSRTSLLALMAAIITYFLWKLITRHIGIYYAFLISVIIGIIIITVFYPQLERLPIFESINSGMIGSTGKNLFSGREKIWLQSMDLIMKKPIAGYGMDATLEGLAGGYLSTHNVYLQLLLQGGILLLLPFVIFIVWLWKILYKVAGHKHAQIGASCLIGILTIGTFELYLFDQVIPLGIIQWFILGWAVSAYIRTKDLKELN